MTQKQRAGQTFEGNLYGMFMEIFRLVGTTVNIASQERIRTICGEIKREFIKAGSVKQVAASVLNSMKPIIKILENKISTLEEDIKVLQKAIESQNKRVKTLESQDRPQ